MSTGLEKVSSYLAKNRQNRRIVGTCKTVHAKKLSKGGEKGSKQEGDRLTLRRQSREGIINRFLC